MKSPVRYLNNLIRNSVLRLRYGTRFHAGAVCSFEKLHVEIYGRGRIRIGNYGQNRGVTYLIADGGTIEIGAHTYFSTNNHIAAMEQIRIGSHVKIGPNVVIVDHDHDYRGDMEQTYVKTPVVIGDGTWIGANVTILRGAQIGRHCVIAAGSVVRGQVPDGEVYKEKRIQG